MKFTKFMRCMLGGVCILALAGCSTSGTGDSKDVQNNTVGVLDSQNPDTNPDASTENGEADNAETSDNSDGNSLICSSTLQGSVVDFSDNGCTVTPVTNEDENTAVIAAPGSESDETNVTVSYQADCIFQIANISITTGKASISDASVSDIKKQTFLLIYGDFEDTYHLTAEKIIIARYE